MSIHRDTKRGQFVFEFDRTIEGQRVRSRSRLPKAWTRTEADAFDRKESARLYALATGVARNRALIEDAISFYMADKKHLKTFKEAMRNLSALYGYYKGRYLDELPEVTARIAEAESATFAPASTRYKIALLRAACRWAWKKHGLGESDPGSRVQVPVVRNERHVYIRLPDLHRILRKCRNAQARAAIVVAFYTGMRLSEIMRATVDDGAFVVLDTKNGTAIKKLPIHPKLARYVRNWPLKCAKITVQSNFQKARTAAGYPHVHFHDIRHAAASELVNAGVDLYTVGAILGHKDPRSTKRYAHLNTESLANAIARIGAQKKAG